MSDRLVPTHTNHQRTRTRLAIACLVLCGTACGLLPFPGVNEARAEPPGQKPPHERTKPGVKKLDQNSPVPADGLNRRPYEAFAINTDRRIFGKIEDFKPVASEAENADEYDAWLEVVLHAKKFATAELEQHAARDLTVIDLLKQFRSSYRCELIRFDGKLVCIRRLEAPRAFTEDPNSEIKELYEARFVPLDESPLTPVSVVFLELPEAFASVKQQPYRKWVDVNSWVTAAGYFFKVMSVPGDEGKVVGVPILVGKGISPLPGPPVPPDSDPTAIDPVRLFHFIRDDAPMVRTVPTELTWPEVAAETRVLLHASRFPAAELEKYARADVKFADLFEPVRKDYRMKNVKFEGRLISLKRVDANAELKAAGIHSMFEGWLIPANEPRGNPICILFTEPLEGVEVGGKENSRVNKWVSFAGYSFKLMRYESAEKFEDEPNRYKVKRAPLLIGKSPIARPDPDAPTSMTWNVFLQVAIGLGALLLAGAGGLAWWYRGGDRKAREAIATARSRNPFGPASAPDANEQ